MPSTRSLQPVRRPAAAASSERRLARAAVVLAGGLLLSATAAGARGGGEPLVAAREYLMGTFAEVRVYAAPSAAAARRATDEVLAELRTIDRLMAVQRSDSDVSRVNRDGARRPVRVDRRVIEVLEASARASVLTAGAFDVTVLPVVEAWGFIDGRPRVPDGAPPRVAGFGKVVIDAAAGTVALADPAAKIDLGGIAKGYALDRARTLLRAAGVEAAYLDLGGNVATLGRPPDGPRWRVGIAHPRRRDGLIGVVEIGEASVSTSGDAEQWVDDRGTRMGHIVDPRSGRPVPGVLAVTVIAPSATLADALSTAAVVRGGQDMEAALRAAEAEAVVARVHAGGRIGVTATPGARLVPAGPESIARTGERP